MNAKSMPGKVPPVILVTGASRGIGAATARLAGARGYAVAINYRSDQAGAEVAAESIRAAGGISQIFQADVSDREAVEAMFARIDASLGRVAVLVNNAGISGGIRPFSEMSADALRDVVGTNLLGAFYCIQAAASRMARSKGGGGGVIVNMSSQAGQFGGNHIATYAATKAGLNTLTMALARELAPDGIRVNAVSPGVIDTDFHDKADSARLKALTASIPAGRMGTPDEVATAVLWLASAEAQYITGSILPVSGGR